MTLTSCAMEGELLSTGVSPTPNRRSDSAPCRVVEHSSRFFPKTERNSFLRDKRLLLIKIYFPASKWFPLKNNSNAKEKLWRWKIFLRPKLEIWERQFILKNIFLWEMSLKTLYCRLTWRKVICESSDNCLKKLDFMYYVKWNFRTI